MGVGEELRGQNQETLVDPEIETLKPADLQFYFNGSDALHALEKTIDQAACQIDVLMFQWENDPTGAEIAAHIKARANSHVRVRILVDNGGNLFFGQPCRGKDKDLNRVIH